MAPFHRDLRPLLERYDFPLRCFRRHRFLLPARPACATPLNSFAPSATPRGLPELQMCELHLPTHPPPSPRPAALGSSDMLRSRVPIRLGRDNPLMHRERLGLGRFTTGLLLLCLRLRFHFGPLRLRRPQFLRMCSKFLIARVHDRSAVISSFSLECPHTTVRFKPCGASQQLENKSNKENEN